MKPTRIILGICLALISIAPVHSEPKLIITNDGPAILDASVTFRVSLRHYYPWHPLIYQFDDGVQKSELATEELDVTFTRTFSSDLYSDGLHFMNITVLANVIFFKTFVVANFTTFDLKYNLIGRIHVSPLEDPNTLDVDEVAIGDNTYLTVDLADHSGFLQDARIDYSWSVDFERLQTLNSTLIYKFMNPGMKDIKVAVTAMLPNNDFKYGFFERSINAKIPVNNISVSGNPFLYHGDKLNLNITCNGTPPFIYCYEFLRRNISMANFTCKQVSTFSTCHMEIIRYIQDDGLYNIGIYVSNNVREAKRIIEVMVYSVTVKPTLSTVIIPIVCSLLTLIIIAFGISFYIQQRNQLAVEVANFDFQDDSDSYTERTFFENICDSFMCRRCLWNRLSCNPPIETDPLI